jgi:hypothetical protein
MIAAVVNVLFHALVPMVNERANSRYGLIDCPVGAVPEHAAPPVGVSGIRRRAASLLEPIGGFFEDPSSGVVFGLKPRDMLGHTPVVP